MAPSGSISNRFDRRSTVQGRAVEERARDRAGSGAASGAGVAVVDRAVAAGGLPGVRVRPALLALALDGFSIGTTEFAIMGLLPQIAGDLRVSIPVAGHVITAYALGVVVGAPLLTAAAARVDRRVLLIALMVAFTVGNVLSAFAPSAGWLVAARFVAGCRTARSSGSGLSSARPSWVRRGAVAQSPR